MTTLVPFYKEIKKDSKQIEEMKTVFDYRNAVDLLKQSFNKYNPKNKFVLATDQDTEMTQVECFRSDLKNMNIMESLTVSNTDYVVNNTGKMVLCGVDHLICNDIDKFFKREQNPSADDTFDIGLFVRWDEINNTVVLVNKKENNKKSVDRFFERRLEHFYNLDTDVKSWYGDQKSYTTLLQEENILTDYGTKSQRLFAAFDLKIKLFSYGQYVKPLKTGGGIKHNPSNILIDFKGPKRKEHFESAFNRIMWQQ